VEVKAGSSDGYLPNLITKVLIGRFFGLYLRVTEEKAGVGLEVQSKRY
jgi:hypothetical protein